ncbi:hypothetical protein [Legionella maceachernii]|uniref:Uncharacterized protein n=1 Tax=Legionella maceachernii TaxID=466 RepID=A0A0W0VX81_9GAMM|nr:hypothetical protein [Legionella maceachernii]KTD24569.1 hypothetical protein Lmac_2656 [Legionella maceachernii]SJZ62759.1 hypothetical protein SAMN02745128_00647 [Legionella maceachernii]SUP01003.1 Uncharacterised protein [Legionella maceachernii]
MANTYSMLKTLKPDAKKPAANVQQKNRVQDTASAEKKEREKKQPELKPSMADVLKASITPTKGGPSFRK